MNKPRVRVLIVTEISLGLVPWISLVIFLDKLQTINFLKIYLHFYHQPRHEPLGLISFKNLHMIFRSKPNISKIHTVVNQNKLSVFYLISKTQTQSLYFS
jgi:hypothetical protein